MPLTPFASLCDPHQKIVVSRDRGSQRRHVANNPHASFVTHYRIDGVVITKGTRCDYLLINEDRHTAYLIELKGSDLSKAVTQLANTEILLGDWLESYALLFRIVASKSRTHEIESVAFKKFRMANKERLRYATDILEEDIS